MPAQTLPYHPSGIELHRSSYTKYHVSRPPRPSTPDSDTETAPSPSFTSNVHLRASIATVSEERLREIMVKLTECSSSFRHAVAKELLSSDAPASASTASAPMSPPRRKHRPSRRVSEAATTSSPFQKCANCGERFKHRERDGTSIRDRDPECTFHSGRLEEEVYEFVSRTPEGRSFKVLRKIKMWSCCDEDAQSVGCVSAPAHVGSV